MRPDDRVLDAGCGFGGSAFWLARELDARVVGINLVPAQIYQARRLAYRYGLSHLLAFERQDFIRTTFPDESFDVVWAIESVCHTPEKEGFLAEARWLLRPGGRLVVADLFRSARSFEPAEEDLLASWLSGWAIPDLATPGEFCEYARQAGFAEVGMEDTTANVWPSLRRLRRRALAGYPMAGLLQAQRLDREGQVSSARAGLRQYEALQRGLWSYGIVVAAA